jgi:hypothetical protein
MDAIVQEAGHLPEEALDKLRRMSFITVRNLERAPIMKALGLVLATSTRSPRKSVLSYYKPSKISADLRKKKYSKPSLGQREKERKKI